MFITNKPDSNFRCKKISFMVCSILGAADFSPFLLSMWIPKLRFMCDVGGCGYINKEYFYTISILMVILSVVVLLLTIISASYCCCSPWDIQENQQTVSYVNESQPENTLNTTDIHIAVTK
ncbi:uncharacterized protein LOC127701703 [Mytilus californianus]|uniref:uncharacterized protein LOC127701703 n=1 Tax=Mytilus californianus TaxID=6549 RepID=UPI0022484EB5|nr:uncharacterized protein LOC127701703 [Mytilus californianus]